MDITEVKTRTIRYTEDDIRDAILVHALAHGERVKAEDIVFQGNISASITITEIADNSGK